jgi:hypothetical protein
MNKTDEQISGYGKEALFGPANDPSIDSLSILTDRAVLHIAVKGAADKAQALSLAEAVATKALART